MKDLIQKVRNHSKRITVKLKRHHKKFLFGVLCCGFLALIGMLFFSKSKADSILDFLDQTGSGQGSYGYNGADILTITSISNSYVNIESPVVRNGQRDISSYLFVASTERSQRNPVAYWCFDDVVMSGNKFFVSLTTNSLDPSEVYYIYATPVDSAITGVYNGSCSANEASQFLQLAYSAGNDSTINGLDPCFIIEDSFHGDGEACENHKNSGIINTYSINGVSHIYDGQYITITWNSYSNVDIDIFFRDETRGAFVALGSVNSEQRSFTFEKRYNGDHIIKLRPSDGSQEINYTAHLTNTENLGLATGMTITLNPGWNVFSTPALLSNISFSNEGNGISFSKLESGQWISVMPSTSTITPLEGFLAKNSNNSAVTMYLTYRDTTPSEDMLSKNVSRGRNLLGITTTDDPFYNIHPGLHLDFTKNAITNLLNIITTNYISKNGSIEYPEIGEAYGVFLSSDRIYGGSNSRYLNNGRLYQNDNDNYSEIIRVTPGSYNIPLLKGRVTAARDLSFRNTGFYLEISGANAYEDVAGYEAGGIIYDIIVNVGEGCTSHIDKSLYAQQTDARGYKKIYIPFFNTCNTIPAGDHKISVLIGINSEYARNFKTGMTITMNSLNRLNFNESIINGEIKSSVIEVSHDNLPSLSIVNGNNGIEVNVTTTGTQNFSLGSVQIYGNEPGESVSVLFDTDRSNGYVPFMYVDTYINGDLVNSRLYDTNMIKILVPLAENTGTKISFVGRFENGLLPDAGSFVPKIIVNSILKDGINYITQNCHYYRGRCTQFNGGNYIFHGRLTNVDGGSDNIEGCPIEDMYACLMSEDYDSCVYSCSSSSHINQYPTELIEGYAYAYDNGLTTATTINNANIYGSITKMALAKIMVTYAINVLGLEPNETIYCGLPNDVSTQLNALYDNAYTKLCQLRMTLETGDFQPFAAGTFADFGTWLSRALNHNDPDALNELNNTSPYYEGHLNWLKGQGIISQNNPDLNVIKGYLFVMLMRADENYTSGQLCTPEELLECALSDDPDTCIAMCNEPNYELCTNEELLVCGQHNNPGACVATLCNGSNNEGCTLDELLICAQSNDSEACIATCNTPNNGGCTTEELLECVVADDSEACLAMCQNNP